jgi:hypothetical protein
MTIGRATYERGWNWSTHVGGSRGATSCCVEHYHGYHTPPL